MPKPEDDMIGSGGNPARRAPPPAPPPPAPAAFKTWERYEAAIEQRRRTDRAFMVCLLLFGVVMLSAITTRVTIWATSHRIVVETTR
jgi:hypothetical protein